MGNNRDICTECVYNGMHNDRTDETCDPPMGECLLEQNKEIIKKGGETNVT